MTRYRTALNNILTPYMEKIIDLNKRFKLYNATKELRDMYHPAILKEAAELANTANTGIEAAYDAYMQRLEDHYTPRGSQIDDDDIKLLNPALFQLTQREFNHLIDKHSGNVTMEAALRNYAEAKDLLFDEGVPTQKEKEELALRVKDAALNDIRCNTVYELKDWCVVMVGELYQEAEKLTE